MHARRLSLPGAIGVLVGSLVLAPLAPAQTQHEWTASAVLKDQKGTGWFLAFAPDGKTLAAASGGFDLQNKRRLPNSVRLWDVGKRKLIRTLVANGPMVVGLAFTSDGKQLVAACYDGSFRRLDATTGKEVNRLKFGQHVGSVSFSPDRKLVLLVNPKAVRGQLRLQNEYQLREVDTGKLVKPTRPFPTEPVLAVGPDARSLVITVIEAPDPRVKLPAGVVPLLPPTKGRLWDAKTGQMSAPLLQGMLTTAVFSPDGKLVLSTGLDVGGAPVAGFGAVQFWNVADKKLSGANIPMAFKYSRFAFADDSSLLAAASDDGTIRLFETTMMKEVAVAKGLTARADAVLFAPDGATLAAAQVDGTIRLWTRKSK
jgi:WD40 repeat protein